MHVRPDSSGGQRSSFRDPIRKLVEHPYFQPAVVALILLNGIVIVAETYIMESFTLYIMDKIILWVFTLELLLKLFAWGPKKFFSGPWNIFDFVIVVASLVFYSTPFVSVLRLVRVMRLFRMIPAIPALRKIIDSLIKSLPALTGILGLAILLFSIYAIIGTTFFRNALPYEFFGSFHNSLFTLMQVVTFESWASQIARPVIAQVPWSWIYFVSFIIIGALVILNLVVAVILSYLGQDDDEVREKQMEQLLEENKSLRSDIREIKELLTEKRSN